nr:MAG TPA: helix-turn-helix domain protein [Caudoviricetes sp.]
MTRYLGTAGVAALTGLAYNTVTAYRSRGKLPRPDVIVEESSTETWGWHPETIERWVRERPRKQPGKRPSVPYLEDLETGDIVILPEKMGRESLAAWLEGACESPADLAREILSHKRKGDKSFPPRIVMRRAPRLDTVPAGIERRDLRRLACETCVSCYGSTPGQIASVLAAARPTEYDALIAQA